MHWVSSLPGVVLTIIDALDELSIRVVLTRRRLFSRM